MMETIKRCKTEHPSLFLVGACYALCFVLALVLHTGQWLYNRALYASGALTKAVLQIDDFAPVQMQEQEDGTWVTTGSDPQLILNDANLRIDTVRTEFQFSREPLIQTAFYANQEGGYSLRRMVYAREGEAGAQYWFSAGGVQNLRLDPDSSYGNVLLEGDIVVNEPRPAWAFFIPGGTELAVLLLAPAFLAGMATILLEAKKAKNRKSQGKRGEKT